MNCMFKRFSFTFPSVQCPLGTSLLHHLAVSYILVDSFRIVWISSFTIYFFPFSRFSSLTVQLGNGKKKSIAAADTKSELNLSEEASKERIDNQIDLLSTHRTPFVGMLHVLKCCWMYQMVKFVFGFQRGSKDSRKRMRNSFKNFEKWFHWHAECHFPKFSTTKLYCDSLDVSDIRFF